MSRYFPDYLEGCEENFTFPRLPEKHSRYSFKDFLERFTDHINFIKAFDNFFSRYFLGVSNYLQSLPDQFFFQDYLESLPENFHFSDNFCLKKKLAG